MHIIQLYLFLIVFIIEFLNNAHSYRLKQFTCQNTDGRCSGVTHHNFYNGWPIPWVLWRFFLLFTQISRTTRKTTFKSRKESLYFFSCLLYTPFVLQSLYTEQSTLKVPLFVNTLAYSPYIRDTSLIVSWPSKISSLRIISTLKEILPNRNLKILSIFSIGKIFHTKD